MLTVGMRGIENLNNLRYFNAADEKFTKYPIEELMSLLCKNPVMTENRMEEIVKIINNSPETISNIVNFLNGTEKDSIRKFNTIELLKSVEKTVNPNITNDEAFYNVKALFEACK